MSLGANLVYSSAKNVLVRPEARNIGMVFQSYAVWPHLTVYQNIALPLLKGRKRLKKPDAERRVHEVLEAVDLHGMESRPIPMLSGGQQQRVSLARALAVEPDALLMDEPLSNLDARLRERVRDQIRQIAKRFGITVLYVTHDQTEAMALADRIAVMELGQVVQVGRPRELYNQPRTPQVAEFFGDMNWLRGDRVDDDSVETEIGVVCVETMPANEKRVRLGIRPENVVLKTSLPTERNAFLARIAEVTFLGERQQILVDVMGKKLTLRTNGSLQFTSPDAWISLPPAAIISFADLNDHGSSTN
jgi:iron(III) transport system ATP-binding protein